ncbi:hypothetical protein E8E14_014603 [Neopestalotiopsis sp. 37M]|nr:hypothetical protein E8E14_014603 [Neopestalotiopsis sp. 37M]
MGNGTTPGANPAPLYKEKSNAIAALMSRHTSSSSLSFLSSLPSKSNAAQQQQKTPAQLAAAAEDYELDKLAQYDDNMGVGMFAPENRKPPASGADRKLKARLGLTGKGANNKRKGSEWEAVSGVSRARHAGSEDDEEDMGRSGVGRAKKRKRIVAVQESETTDPETPQSPPAQSAETLKSEEPELAGPSEKTTSSIPTDIEETPKTGTTTDQDSAANTDGKKRRKKKKKKTKATGQAGGATSN